MKTVQFNANNILCGNNYPIAYYYPIAKDLVVISTGHDDSIIDDSMGYSEYIIPILEAIQKTSIKVYRFILLRLLLRLPIIKVHIPGYSLRALLIPMPTSIPANRYGSSIYFISGLTRQYYNDTCLTLYAISCYSCLDSYIQISLT